MENKRRGRIKEVESSLRKPGSSRGPKKMLWRVKTMRETHKKGVKGRWAGREDGERSVSLRWKGHMCERMDVESFLVLLLIDASRLIQGHMVQLKWRTIDILSHWKRETCFEIQCIPYNRQTLVQFSLHFSLVTVRKSPRQIKSKFLQWLVWIPSLLGCRFLFQTNLSAT